MPTPSIYAYRSFNPELETVARFAAMGVDQVCIYPANTLNSLGTPYSAYGPTWLGPGEYDFAPLDRQIAELRAANPRVRVLCMIDLNTPPWMERRFTFHDRLHDTFWGLGRTIGSPRWRELTAAYLRAFLAHCESAHGEVMDAYLLACGATCEWQDISRGEESIPRRAAWRAWAAAEGLPDPLDIPPAGVRDHAAHGLVRDPQADRLAIDYWRFTSRQVGDAMLHMAATAQEVLHHRVRLGCFYGYVMEHGRGRLVSEGHADYERVYASPDLDFFVAPAGYADRGMGSSSPFMVPLGTLRRLGKDFVQEIDHKTSTGHCPVPWYTAWAGEAEDVAGLRREFALALVERTSCWWFDMWGRFYEGARVQAELARMAAIRTRLAHRPEAPAAEVLVVMDPASIPYLDQDHPAIDGLARRLQQALSRIGAPFAVHSWGDLPHLDLGRFRLVVFPQLVVMDEERRRLLAERVLGHGRTVLWFHRPGVVCDGRYDLAAVERLTGLPADQAGQTVRPGWISVLAPDGLDDPARLRELAAQAGVHLYADLGDVVYADGTLVALHRATGGRADVRLPRPVRQATELFSGQTLMVEGSTVVVDLPDPGTVLIEWA